LLILLLPRTALLLTTPTRAATSLQQAQELIVFRIQTLLLHLLLSLRPFLRIRQLFVLLHLLLFGFVIELASPETRLILVDHGLDRGSDALVALPGSLTDLEAAKFLQELKTLAILVLKVSLQFTLMRGILDFFFLLPQLLVAGSRACPAEMNRKVLWLFKFHICICEGTLMKQTLLFPNVFLFIRRGLDVI
jgi:hypothetical protein